MMEGGCSFNFWHMQRELYFIQSRQPNFLNPSSMSVLNGSSINNTYLPAGRNLRASFIRTTSADQCQCSRLCTILSVNNDDNVSLSAITSRDFHAYLRNTAVNNQITMNFGVLLSGNILFLEKYILSFKFLIMFITVMIPHHYLCASCMVLALQIKLLQ